jgi:hypothetical protein
MYDRTSNKYMIANIRQMPLPTNEPEHFEDWRPFMGYTDTDGCVVSLSPPSKSDNCLVAIQSWSHCAKPCFFLRLPRR